MSDNPILSTLDFDVEGEPIPAGRPRVVHGHAFRPAATTEYMSAVTLAALKAMKDDRWPEYLRVTRYVTFGVDLFITRKRQRGDVDNYAKGILDALTRARVWDDDGLVDSLSIVVVSAAPDKAPCARICIVARRKDE